MPIPQLRSSDRRMCSLGRQAQGKFSDMITQLRSSDQRRPPSAATAAAEDRHSVFRLAQHIRDDTTEDIGQPEVTPGVTVGESFVIQAELM